MSSRGMGEVPHPISGTQYAALNQFVTDLKVELAGKFGENVPAFKICKSDSLIKLDLPISGLLKQGNDLALLHSGTEDGRSVVVGNLYRPEDKGEVDIHPFGFIMVNSGTSATVKVLEHAKFDGRITKGFSDNEIDLIRSSGVYPYFSNKIGPSAEYGRFEDLPQPDRTSWDKWWEICQSGGPSSGS